MGKLVITPITQKEAKAYIKTTHRHHAPPVGSIFQLAVALDGEIVGVAMVGRPVSRHIQDGYTVEVNRVATNGTPNACSKLYRAAWRVARELGYRRLITYTLPEEGGGSLRGANMVCLGTRGGGSWSSKNRPRVDTHPTQAKLLWELTDE